MVQAYVKRVCEEGGAVSSQIVIGAARGILKTIDNRNLENSEVTLTSTDIGHFHYCVA